MGISENIKLLREKYNITQEELAGIAGVTDKAVSFWELGTHTPRMGAIQRMSDYFGLQKSNIIEEGGMSGILCNADSVSVSSEERLISILIANDMYDAIEDFKNENHYLTRTEAVTGLIRLGLKALKQEKFEKENSKQPQAIVEPAAYKGGKDEKIIPKENLDKVKSRYYGKPKK